MNKRLKLGSYNVKVYKSSTHNIDRPFAWVRLIREPDTLMVQRFHLNKWRNGCPSKSDQTNDKNVYQGG